jgi:UDP-N-acetylglucosamine diphosphorylase/glucosamine-1-phosphate N-acetyltransferase
MAGGLGKRMKSDLPKVLHKSNGIPMIVRIIKTTIEIQPKKILIVVGKFKDLIESTISESIQYPIEYVYQKEPLGTGHAVQCCIPYLPENGKVVILSGDVPMISKSTILNLVEKTERCGLIYTEVDFPKGLGRIKLSNGKFEAIVEEKDCNEEERLIRYVNSGIYCIESFYIKKYIQQIGCQNAQKEYYLTDLIGILKFHFDISLYPLSKDLLHEVLGVNDPEELLRLENIFFS